MKEPKLLRRWLDRQKERGGLFGRGSFTRIGEILKRAPSRFQGKSLKDLKLENISQYEKWFRVGLVVLTVFVLAEIAGRVIALFIPTVPMEIAQKPAAVAPSVSRPTEDYEVILQRNIFNVEGKIPDPLDQGRMDCFSQAKPSSQRLTLLGTIVMSDENFSVALIQEDGNPIKFAVKKDDLFADSKYQAIKVERKRLCFQVKASQDFEFVEIPDDSAKLGFAPSIVGGVSVEGITPVSQGEYRIKKNFLEDQMRNLTDILQTAKAVPHIEGGKFRGFHIQSMDPNSPFRALGVNQGDILIGVNDIVLNDPGKGLEAFQRLRNSSSITLKILRGGQEQTINYSVN